MNVDAPLSLHSGTIQPEWIDYNGHMNVAFYVLVFDHGTDAFLDFLGMDERYRQETGFTTYVLETHVTYDRELKEGDPFRVETQLLDHDAKRLHYFQRLFHAGEGFLAATTEIMLMHIDSRGPRAAPMPEEVQARVRAVLGAHRELPRPVEAGRVIGIRRSA
ncbi:MAG: thioesterase family protein [Gammaproteobacteria bacterium]|nr:thioesterase family protein [Gammaproteobacteria bacterium]